MDIPFGPKFPTMLRRYDFDLNSSKLQGRDQSHTTTGAMIPQPSARSPSSPGEEQTAAESTRRAKHLRPSNFRGRIASISVGEPEIVKGQGRTRRVPIGRVLLGVRDAQAVTCLLRECVASFS